VEQLPSSAVSVGEPGRSLIEEQVRKSREGGGGFAVRVRQAELMGS